MPRLTQSTAPYLSLHPLNASQKREEVIHAGFGVQPTWVHVLALRHTVGPWASHLYNEYITLTSLQDVMAEILCCLLPFKPSPSQFSPSELLVGPSQVPMAFQPNIFSWLNSLSFTVRLSGLRVGAIPPGSFPLLPPLPPDGSRALALVPTVPHLSAQQLSASPSFREPCEG